MHFETSKGFYIDTDKPAESESPSQQNEGSGEKISAELIAVICVVSVVALIAVGVVVFQHKKINFLENKEERVHIIQEVV